MQVAAVFENGLFRPLNPIVFPEHKEVILRVITPRKTLAELEKEYAEASSDRPDLKDWEILDEEGLE